MADKKYSQLPTASEALADDDYFPFLNTSTALTEKVAKSVLMTGVGDASGPGSSTDNAVARFDGAAGKTLQNSLMTVDDAGGPNIPAGQVYNIDGSPHAHAGMGDVVGPGSSVDNTIPRYDSTTGKLIQTSLVTIDDSGSPNIPSGQTYNINGSAHTHVGLVVYSLKSIFVDLEYYDATPKIRVTCYDGYNQGDVAPEDLAKSDVGTNYTFSADGYYMYLTGITGIPEGGLRSATMHYNNTGTHYITPGGWTAPGYIVACIMNASGNYLDLTSVLTTGKKITILYDFITV